MSDLGAPQSTYDGEAGYLCIRPDLVGDAVGHTIEVSPTVLVDFAGDGTLVGIETIGGPVDYAALYAVLRAWPKVVAS